MFKKDCKCSLQPCHKEAGWDSLHIPSMLTNVSITRKHDNTRKHGTIGKQGFNLSVWGMFIRTMWSTCVQTGHIVASDRAQS